MSSKGNKRLRGSTLPELIVVMALGSIILLIVTDGLNLFARFSGMVTERITRNSELWDDYCLMENLVREADSLRRTQPDAVDIFKDGSIATLALKDSTLIYSQGNISDTIFRSVSSMEIPPLLDSVIITIAGNAVRIGFAILPKPDKMETDYSEIEEKYRKRYEEPR